VVLFFKENKNPADHKGRAAKAPTPLTKRAVKAMPGKIDPVFHQCPGSDHRKKETGQFHVNGSVCDEHRQDKTSAASKARTSRQKIRRAMSRRNMTSRPPYKRKQDDSR